MDNNKQCPCGSGKAFNECCKKQYDAINETRQKLKKAMADPLKADELKALLKQAEKN